MSFNLLVQSKAATGFAGGIQQPCSQRHTGALHQPLDYRVRMGWGGREYVVICGDGEEVEIIWLKIRAWRASGSSFRYGREAEDHSHHC